MLRIYNFHFILIIFGVHLANFISCKRKWNKYSNDTQNFIDFKVNILGLIGLFIATNFLIGVVYFILCKIGINLNENTMMFIILISNIITQSIATHDAFANDGIKENYTYDIYLEDNPYFLTTPEKRKLHKMKKNKVTHNKHLQEAENSTIILSERDYKDRYRIISSYTVTHPNESIEMKKINGLHKIVRVRYEEVPKEEYEKWMKEYKIENEDID